MTNDIVRLSFNPKNLQLKLKIFGYNDKKDKKETMQLISHQEDNLYPVVSFSSANTEV